MSNIEWTEKKRVRRKKLDDGRVVSASQYYRLRRAATDLGCKLSEVPDTRGKHNNHVKGTNHHRWNDVLKSTDGYELVRVGKDHPLHNANGYAYKHRVVMSEKLGRYLLPDEIVHHINGNKSDNRPENLELTTRSEHNRHHNATDKGRDAATGRFTGVLHDNYPVQTTHV